MPGPDCFPAADTSLCLQIRVHLSLYSGNRWPFAAGFMSGREQLVVFSAGKLAMQLEESEERKRLMHMMRELPDFVTMTNLHSGVAVQKKPMTGDFPFHAPCITIWRCCCRFLCRAEHGVQACAKANHLDERLGRNELHEL